MTKIKMEQETKKSDYLLASSIIIAALLIASAWIYTSKNSSQQPTVSDRNQADFQQTQQAQQDQAAAALLDNLKIITDSDHWRGNQNAPVKIVEFVDLECPFCKKFHQQILQQVLDNYPDKVELIFRNYPLEQLHTKSKRSAQAAECAAELGGNDKFWEFVDNYFVMTPSNDGMDMSQLPIIAQNIGLDRSKFVKCQNSNRYLDKIDAQIQEAQNIGAQGTPFSVVISPNGKKYPVPGAYPYDYPQKPEFSMKNIIDTALKN